MNSNNYEITSAFLLLTTLTRALVATKKITKEDLLAELSRLQLAVPPQAVAQVQELISNLPDQ